METIRCGAEDRLQRDRNMEVDEMLGTGARGSGAGPSSDLTDAADSRTGGLDPSAARACMPMAPQASFDLSLDIFAFDAHVAEPFGPSSMRADSRWT